MAALGEKWPSRLFKLPIQKAASSLDFRGKLKSVDHVGEKAGAIFGNGGVVFAYAHATGFTGDKPGPDHSVIAFKDWQGVQRLDDVAFLPIRAFYF